MGGGRGRGRGGGGREGGEGVRGRMRRGVWWWAKRGRGGRMRGKKKEMR